MWSSFRAVKRAPRATKPRKLRFDVLEDRRMLSSATILPADPGGHSGISATTNDGLSPTTTVLTGPTNPVGVDCAASFSVSVASSDGGLPGGTVTLLDGSTPLYSFPIGGGTESFSYTTWFTVVGDHTITAVYAGDANYLGSTSAPLAQTVMEGTTTTLTASANPSAPGQSVTFTATVSPYSASMSPTGTVTFDDGGTTLGTEPLADQDGVMTATFTTNQLVPGEHMITASYTPDAGTFFQPTSDSITQTVDKAGVEVNLSSSPSSPLFGQEVTLTAVIDPTSATLDTPTGTVTFTDTVQGVTTTLGTASAVGSPGGATALLLVDNLAVGAHTILAHYSGDGNFDLQTGTFSLNVGNSGTLKSTIDVTLSPASPLPGQTVVLTAKVRGVKGAPLPTGTVTIVVVIAGQQPSDDQVPLRLVHGVATATSTGVAGGDGAGRHKITAIYSGDTVYLPSTSKPVAVTVAKDKTSTTVAASLKSSVFGQDVTLTATINAAVPNPYGTPTGIVIFKDDGKSLGVGTLSTAGGTTTATLTTSALAAGSRSVTAVYYGDKNFKAGTSPSLVETVKKAATATRVVSSANPSTLGQKVTFTATIGVSAPGAGTPTGTVTFLDGTKKLGTGTLKTVNGVTTATLSTSALGAGSCNITVQYAGDADFTGGVSPGLVQVVGQQAPTATLAPAIGSALAASGPAGDPSAMRRAHDAALLAMMG